MKKSGDKLGKFAGISPEGCWDVEKIRMLGGRYDGKMNWDANPDGVDPWKLWKKNRKHGR